MAKFMDVHSGFIGVSEQQLREAHERDLAIEADESVHSSGPGWTSGPARSSASRPGLRRRASCGSTSAPDHPTTEVYEIPIDIA
jgi:hypothetical protein